MYNLTEGYIEIYFNYSIKEIDIFKFYVNNCSNM